MLSYMAVAGAGFCCAGHLEKLHAPPNKQKPRLPQYRDVAAAGPSRLPRAPRGDAVPAALARSLAVRRAAAQARALTPTAPTPDRNTNKDGRDENSCSRLSERSEAIESGKGKGMRRHWATQGV